MKTSHSQSLSADLSHPCAMKGATEKNTSPVSAFLRALAMSENRYDSKRKADEVDGSEGLSPDGHCGSDFRDRKLPASGGFSIPGEQVITEAKNVCELVGKGAKVYKLVKRS